MSGRYQNEDACGIEPEVEGEEPTLEQWRERCRSLWHEVGELRHRLGVIADAVKIVMASE